MPRKPEPVGAPPFSEGCKRGNELVPPLPMSEGLWLAIHPRPRRVAAARAETFAPGPDGGDIGNVSLLTRPRLVGSCAGTGRPETTTPALQAYFSGHCLFKFVPDRHPFSLF